MVFLDAWPLPGDVLQRSILSANQPEKKVVDFNRQPSQPQDTEGRLWHELRFRLFRLCWEIVRRACANLAPSQQTPPTTNPKVKRGKREELAPGANFESKFLKKLAPHFNHDDQISSASTLGATCGRPPLFFPAGGTRIMHRQGGMKQTGFP